MRHGRPEFYAALAAGDRPMVSQRRAVLEQAGWEFTEVVYEECGHSPHLEHPQRLASDVRAFLQR